MSNLPPDIQGLSLIESSFKPKDISLPLPLTPHTTLHIKLSLLEKNTVVFLTSTDYSTSGTSSPLGSFVYAMPNVGYCLLDYLLYSFTQSKALDYCLNAILQSYLHSSIPLHGIQKHF